MGNRERTMGNRETEREQWEIDTERAMGTTEKCRVGRESE